MNTTAYNAFEVTTAAMSSLVEFYNAHAAKPVKKFADRVTAERRVAALIAERTAQSQAPLATKLAHRAEVADTRDELGAARDADFRFRSNCVTGFSDHGHVDCPHCGIHLQNGVSTHGDDVNGKALRHDTHRYECMGCGGGFGAALAKKSLSRSTAIARTWAEPTIKAARAERTAVLVARGDGGNVMDDRGVVSDRAVYGSVAKAFRALGLNMGQHIGFRMALKAAGQKNFGPYEFTVQA